MYRKRMGRRNTKGTLVNMVRTNMEKGDVGNGGRENEMFSQEFDRGFSESVSATLTRNLAASRR